MFTEKVDFCNLLWYSNMFSQILSSFGLGNSIPINCEVMISVNIQILLFYYTISFILTFCTLCCLKYNYLKCLYHIDYIFEILASFHFLVLSFMVYFNIILDINTLNIGSIMLLMFVHTFGFESIIIARDKWLVTKQFNDKIKNNDIVDNFTICLKLSLHHLTYLFVNTSTIFNVLLIIWWISHLRFVITFFYPNKIKEIIFLLINITDIIQIPIFLALLIIETNEYKYALVFITIIQIYYIRTFWKLIFK